MAHAGSSTVCLNSVGMNRITFIQAVAHVARYLLLPGRDRCAGSRSSYRCLLIFWTAAKGQMDA
jgi:hypothetical protein